MKKLILLITLTAASIALACQGKVFSESGTSNNVNALEAEQIAKALANEHCRPRQAIQVGAFDDRRISYVLVATADFRCEE